MVINTSHFVCSYSCMTPFLIRLNESAATTGTFPLGILPILQSCIVYLEELLFTSVSSPGVTSSVTRSRTMRRSGEEIATTTSMTITVPATAWRTETRARRIRCGHATVMKFVLHTVIFSFHTTDLLFQLVVFLFHLIVLPWSVVTLTA